MGIDEVDARNHRVDLHDREEGVRGMRGYKMGVDSRPRVAWSGLRAALTGTGINVTVTDLVATPLIEVDKDVEGQLTESAE
jgi:hypothetical protein